MLTARVDSDNIRVAERGGRSRLAEEAVEGRLVADFPSNNLDRHVTIEPGVPGQIHVAHAARSNLSEDVEFADLQGRSSH
jgi:hypothetical protein